MKTLFPCSIAPPLRFASWSSKPTCPFRTRESFLNSIAPIEMAIPRDGCVRQCKPDLQSVCWLPGSSHCLETERMAQEKYPCLWPTLIAQPDLRTRVESFPRGG